MDKPFDLKTWGGFDNLPKEGDYLLDIEELNRRMSERNNNPFRWQEGTFKVPKGISRALYEKYVKSACDQFVKAFEKKGWTLTSKLQLFGPHYAKDLEHGIVLLDQVQFTVRGIFAIAQKPVRVEIDTIKKEEPDERVPIEVAMRIMGVQAVSRKEREAAAPR